MNNDIYNEEPYEVCAECGVEFFENDIEHLAIYFGEHEVAEDGREYVKGYCADCARQLAKDHGLDLSDAAARLFEDEGDKIAESVIPYLYTYDELMALVRKDIAERRLAGYMPDVKKIDDALYKFCKDDDTFFIEYIEKLNKGEKK